MLIQDRQGAPDIPIDDVLHQQVVLLLDFVRDRVGNFRTRRHDPAIALEMTGQVIEKSQLPLGTACTHQRMVEPAMAQLALLLCAGIAAQAGR